MIEHVEGLELELKFRLLGEREVLEQAQIDVEELRTAARIAPDVSEGVTAGLYPRTSSQGCTAEANRSRSTCGV